jgi:type III pantothenate kinase
MVDGLIRRIRGELAGGDQAMVIGTGGLSEVIAEESRGIQRLEPDLTLEGLRIIWHRQSSNG